jgi:hypothetical protein
MKYYTNVRVDDEQECWWWVAWTYYYVWNWYCNDRPVI